MGTVTRCPAHPGETLRTDYLQPLEMTVTDLAKALCVPPHRIYGLIKGKSRVDAELGLRLAHYFGHPERRWMELQLDYDCWVASRMHGPTVQEEIAPLPRSEARQLKLAQAS